MSKAFKRRMGIAASGMQKRTNELNGMYLTPGTNTNKLARKAKKATKEAAWRAKDNPPEYQNG